MTFPADPSTELKFYDLYFSSYLFYQDLLLLQFTFLIFNQQFFGALHYKPVVVVWHIILEAMVKLTAVLPLNI